MTSYLITYQRRSGAVKVTAFDSFRKATSERLRLDRENDDPDTEIVAVASESESHLRKSHSRYFSAV